MAETIESLRAVLERINRDVDGLVASCARCGAQPVRLDASYEDDFWYEVAPEKYRRGVLCLDCVNHYALYNGISVLPRLRIAYITTWDGTRPFVPASALASALERLAAAGRFVRAHDAVEAGTLSFDLQHATVRELKAARKAIDWIALTADCEYAKALADAAPAAKPSPPKPPAPEPQILTTGWPAVKEPPNG